MQLSQPPICRLCLGKLRLCSHYALTPQSYLSPQPLATTLLFYVSVNFPFLDPSSFLCLAYLTQHNVFKVHSYSNLCQFPSFVRLNNIPLYVYTTFCLSSHPLMDIWAASTFWLLWIMLQWTWACKYLFESLLSILVSFWSIRKLCCWLKWKWSSCPCSQFVLYYYTEGLIFTL